MYSVSSTSCQVYPSENAYQDNSITRSESTNVNCRNYPAQGEDHSEYYIHCDWQQLKLTDSNLGQEQYQSSNYYWWIAGSDEQLLFIFPTVVSLTTITLHYYSDSGQGLPRLKFYATAVKQTTDTHLYEAVRGGGRKTDKNMTCASIVYTISTTCTHLQTVASVYYM